MHVVIQRPLGVTVKVCLDSYPYIFCYKTVHHEAADTNSLLFQVLESMRILVLPTFKT